MSHFFSDPSHRDLLRRLAILCLASIAWSRPVSAQTMTVGASGVYDGNLNPSRVMTVLELSPADFEGQATSASFGWSASPCPASVKIKFFHTFPFPNQVGYVLSAERGPFDVTQVVQTSDPSRPPVTQTVALVPPVSLKAGDLVAVTNLTTCGGPTFARAVSSVGPLPPPLPASWIVPGDTSAISQTTPSEAVFVLATGPSPVLALLNGRFAVTLDATNPRNGAVAAGVPNPLGSSAGFFSLPDFTGDPTFPEVTVKMVDATGSPALGGDFWFFHAPLTDVQYTLTVEDRTTGAVKTYSNGSGSSGQLCGGVDTSAFPGH
jgi:hypothetical protein